MDGSEILNRIEKQLEYSLYITITICLLSLYTSFSIYERQKPLREIETFKNYVELFNQQKSDVILITKNTEAEKIVNQIKNNLTNAIESQLNYKLDWGVYTIHSSLEQFFFPVLNKHTAISSETTVKIALDSLSNDENILIFKDFRCETNRKRVEERGVTFYYNVKSLNILDNVNKKNINLEILIGKSRENNTLTFGEKFNIICNCDIDTSLLKSDNKYEWVKTNLPWIYKHLDEIGNKKLRDFNKLWEDRLTEEVLGEEQSIIGLKFHNSSLSIIAVSLLISIFIFHLSLLSELLKNRSQIVSGFSSGILYRNRWAYLLRLFAWLVTPILTIFANAYFISHNPVIMIWILPILILGVNILRKINTFNAI